MRLGFLLLIGLPSSGKTTLAKYLLQNSERNSEEIRHFVHVCYDDLIHFTNWNHKVEWKLARNSVSIKIEKLILAIKNKNVDFCPWEFKNQLTLVKCWECDFVLILDDNMYFKSMRYSLFQIAKKYSMGFCQVFLSCSLDNALMKNDIRGQDSKIPSDVIKNMHSKIEPPNCKNNWEKYSVEIQAFCNLNEISNEVFFILKKSLNNVFHENNDTELKALSRIQCEENVIHQTDLELRKIVNCKIKKYFEENSKFDSKAYIKSLTSKKSEIVSDIKAGNICLPEEILLEIHSKNVEKVKLINYFDGYF